MGVRQWNLSLLPRWVAQASRGTSCLGLIPFMMSCTRVEGGGRAG